MLLAVVAMMAIVGCGDSEAGDGLSVVVTTSVLGDIVENVVETKASVEVLVPIGADPHDYQLSASQAADISNADLVVVNGLGLEEGILDAIASLREDGANVIEIGPMVDPIPLAGASCDPNAAASGCDPHVWMDPMRMIEAVRVIETALVELDPTGGWSAAADAYVGVLGGLNQEVETLLSAIGSADRKLVTNHESLEYMASRYGLHVIGVVIPGGSTLGAPSSAELADLVSLMVDEDVRVIFADVSSSEELADAVASEIGSEVQVIELYTESLGEPGTEAGTYIGMIRTNAMLIAEALG